MQTPHLCTLAAKQLALAMWEPLCDCKANKSMDVCPNVVNLAKGSSEFDFDPQISWIFWPWKIRRSFQSNLWLDKSFNLG